MFIRCAAVVISRASTRLRCRYLPWHARSAQWFGLAEDQAPTKGKGALHGQTCIKIFDWRRKVRLVQETRMIIRPGWPGDPPPPRQMLAYSAECCVMPGLCERRRRCLKHSWPPIGGLVKFVEKFAQR